MERQQIAQSPVVGEEPAARSSEPLVYTVREAAARLKVSTGTVRNMIEEGQLYGIRLHVRRIVVPRWAVEELVGRPSRWSDGVPRQ